MCELPLGPSLARGPLLWWPEWGDWPLLAALVAHWHLGQSGPSLSPFVKPWGVPAGQ